MEVVSCVQACERGHLCGQEWAVQVLQPQVPEVVGHTGPALHTGHDVRTVRDSTGTLALKAGRPETRGMCTAAQFTRAKL